MQVIILGSGTPLPDRTGPGHPPWCARRPATCSSIAGGGCSCVPGPGPAPGPPGRVLHPPAQRPHHRPQRHHTSRWATSFHPTRCRSSARPAPPPGGGDRGDAGHGHRLPLGPSRRPQWALVRRHRGAERRRLRGGRGAGHGRPHRPCARPPHGGVPHRRRRSARSSSPATRCRAPASTTSAPGPTCSSTPSSGAT